MPARSRCVISLAAVLALVVATAAASDLSLSRFAERLKERRRRLDAGDEGVDRCPADAFDCDVCGGPSPSDYEAPVTKEDKGADFDDELVVRTAKQLARDAAARRRLRASYSRPVVDAEGRWVRNMSLLATCVGPVVEDTCELTDHGRNAVPGYLRTSYAFSDKGLRPQPIGTEAHLDGLTRLYVKHSSAENKVTMEARARHVQRGTHYYPEYALRIKEKEVPEGKEGGWKWAIVELARLKRLARHRHSGGLSRRRIIMRRNILQSILRETLEYENWQYNRSFLEPPKWWRAKYVVPQLQAEIAARKAKLAVEREAKEKERQRLRDEAAAQRRAEKAERDAYLAKRQAAEDAERLAKRQRAKATPPKAEGEGASSGDL